LQAKTKLPTAKGQRHADASLHAQRLKITVVGVLDHHEHNNSDGFRVFLTRGDEFGSDANVTCSILWRCIQAAAQKHGVLPKDLYIQVFVVPSVIGFSFSDVSDRKVSNFVWFVLLGIVPPLLTADGQHQQRQ